MDLKLDQKFNKRSKLIDAFVEEMKKFGISAVNRSENMEGVFQELMRQLLVKMEKRYVCCWTKISIHRVMNLMKQSSDLLFVDRKVREFFMNLDVKISDNLEASEKLTNKRKLVHDSLLKGILEPTGEVKNNMIWVKTLNAEDAWALNQSGV